MSSNRAETPRRGPMGRGMATGEKAKDFKEAVRRLIKELGKFKILIIISLILAIIGAVLSISAPDQLSKMTDEIQKGLMAEMDMDAIKSITIFLCCLYGCSAIFTFIQGLCMTNVANNFARSLRKRISIKINKLPLSYFDQHQAGDTLSRVTNDVDMIAQTMNQSLGSLVTNITLFLGSIIFFLSFINSLKAKSLVALLSLLCIRKPIA